MYGTAMAVLTNNIFLSVRISKLFEPRAVWAITKGLGICNNI